MTLGAIFAFHSVRLEAREQQSFATGCQAILHARRSQDSWRVASGDRFLCGVLGDTELAWSPRYSVLVALDGLKENQRCPSAESLAEEIEKRGLRALEEVREAFSAVVWHRHEGWTAAARDSLGSHPLYQASDDGVWMISTDICGLLAARPRRSRIAQARLGDFFLGLETADTKQTFYTGVHRVPVAGLTVRSRSGSQTHHPCYRLEATVPSGEAAAELERRIAEASGACLGASKQGALFLSGGIDSAVVAGMACRSRRSLLALSAVTRNMACQESRRARQSATSLGLRQVEISLDSPPRCEPLLLGREWGDEPFDLFMTLPGILCREARLQSLDVALTGLDGDFLASVSDQSFLHLAKERRRLEAVRELIARRKTLGHRACLSSLLAWHYGHLPLGLRHSLRQKRARHAFRRRLSQLPIRRSWALKHGLEERFLHTWQAPRAAASPAALHARSSASPILPAALERYHRVAGRYDLALRHPLLQPRVWRAALALPLHQMWHGGWNKLILRRLAGRWIDKELAQRRPAPGLNWAFTQRRVHRELTDFFSQPLSLQRRRLEPISHAIQVDLFRTRTEDAWRRSRWYLLGPAWGLLAVSDLIAAIENHSEGNNNEKT